VLLQALCEVRRQTVSDRRFSKLLTGTPRLHRRDGKGAEKNFNSDPKIPLLISRLCGVMLPETVGGRRDASAPRGDAISPTFFARCPLASNDLFHYCPVRPPLVIVIVIGFSYPMAMLMQMVIMVGLGWSRLATVCLESCEGGWAEASFRPL